MAENKVQVRSNIGDQVIARMNTLCEGGFVMPRDYSYVNAIKMSVLKLQDTKDKNGRPAMEACTPNSIQTSLFKMATLGLNAGLNQCYFIVRGNQLCCDPSYFGKQVMVKRIYPEWNAVPVVIREGDVFELAVDPATGKKSVVKHETKLENADHEFIGGYMYLPNGDLYIMTRKEIMTAWSQSQNKDLSVHKKYSEKMVKKTIINTGLNSIINGTPDFSMIATDPIADDNGSGIDEQYSDVVDVVEEEVEAPVGNTPSEDVVPPAAVASNKDDSDEF